MPEKLAIVTIDAGSDVRAKVLTEPKIGTSSGKGAVAKAFRESSFPAMDRGRGFRTIAYAAAENGTSANELHASGLLERWSRTGAFGFVESGLDFQGAEIPDSELHGRRISSIVADFGELADVRNLMKEKTLGWIDWARKEHEAELVALDGREMKELVEEGIQEDGIPDAQLVTSFSMIVNPVEAARRRMASRGEIDYNDQFWYLAPGLMDTILELRNRAIKDEDRELDSVGIPEPHTLLDMKFIRMAEEAFRGSDIWQIALGHDWQVGEEILFDTTGLPEETVQKAALSIVSRLTDGLVNV